MVRTTTCCGGWGARGLTGFARAGRDGAAAEHSALQDTAREALEAGKATEAQHTEQEASRAERQAAEEARGSAELERARAGVGAAQREASDERAAHDRLRDRFAGLSTPPAHPTDPMHSQCTQDDITSETLQHIQFN